MKTMTPGPWVIVRDESEPENNFGIKGADGYWVATVTMHRGTPQDLNARLMVKAPEMAEVLKRLLKLALFAKEYADCNGPAVQPAIDEAERILREAGIEL